MTDPATMALISGALADPKASGAGVRDAATGIGDGTHNAATGIGEGFRESKKGDAEVERARGEARAKQIEAQGNADAARIKAIAEIAQATADLPSAERTEIIRSVIALQMQQAVQQAEEELRQPPSALSSAVSIVAPGLAAGLTASGLMRASAAPGTQITSPQNHGACRSAPAQQIAPGV